MTSPIYVALDTTDLDRAKAIAARVRNHVGGLKLGLEFFSASGPDGVRELAALGLPIFLDLKLHDIPNTVGKAVEALAPLAPAILTVHAAGGRAMMERAKAAAPEGTRVVAISVLTSLDAEELVYFRDVYDHVIRLTDEMDNYRELASSTLDVYLTQVNNNLSVIMKRLTGVTVILAGVGAIAGIFGMSEAGSAISGGEGWGFWLVTGVVVAMASGAAAVLHHIDWI